MGGVLSYSGLSTKIRAMQSRLTTMDQFEEILQLSDVTQVAAYLKRMPEYSSRWDALDENTLHRGQIEKLLKKSIFQNFSRIYHFANPEQRKFLDLYSKRYEIRVLKEVMTNIFDHRDTDPVDVSPYREFFRLHSNIDVDRITTCSTMEELISCLKGNEFYIPLSKIQEHETALLFDYGMGNARQNKCLFRALVRQACLPQVRLKTSSTYKASCPPKSALFWEAATSDLSWQDVLLSKAQQSRAFTKSSPRRADLRETFTNVCMISTYRFIFRIR